MDSRQVINKCDYLSQEFYIPSSQDVDNTFNTIDKMTGKIGNVLSMIDYVISNADERTSISLINYIKSSQIASTCFIAKRISQEEVLKDLLVNLYNIYSGFVMTAVQLNTAISASRTVKDAFSLVSTENYKDPINEYIPLSEKLQSLNPVFQQDPNTDSNTNKSDNQTDDVKIVDIKDKSQNVKASGLSTPSIIVPDKVLIPAGRTLKVTFTTQFGKPIDMILNLMLYPVFVPDEVFDQFLKFQYPTTSKNRWLQWRAGEISFFKDFIFEMDIRKDQRTARKKDKSNILSKMFGERNDHNIQQMKKISTNNQRQNIANTILIVNKSDFEYTCKKAFIKFEDPKVREKFFSTSMCLMMAVVDPNYSTVELYYNGLDKAGIYTYSQLKANAKDEKTDIMDIMKAFSQGLAPRI
jgi:hypothetical protein